MFLKKVVIYSHNKKHREQKQARKNERTNTMKYAECNEHQKKAYRNILNASNWLLGDLENTMEDNPEGSEEYENARVRLADHEGLVNELYRMATTEIYGEGSCFSEGASRFLNDIRFCGKEWLLERCEARIKKAGY